LPSLALAWLSLAEWEGVEAQVAGGLEVRLWRGLHGLLEYKLTSARPRIAVYAGDATVSTLSHHLAVGDVVSRALRLRSCKCNRHG
jgi:hypothetical protein